MDPVAKRVEHHIREHDLLKRGDRVLMSLSAGKDSMAMLHILLNMREDNDFALSIFHLNHGMRGKESDDDAQFVAECARKYSLPLISRSYNFKEFPAKGMSFEEHAREVRYQMLAEAASANGLNKIATAHNSDDAVETVLMRIFTGTGVRGLSGIDVKRGALIRPLLCVTADEIYSLLNRHSITWREDSSNTDERYRRNFIRHAIIPKIKEIFPMLDDSIVGLAGLARETMELLDEQFDRKYPGLMHDIDWNNSSAINEVPEESRSFKYFMARLFRENHLPYSEGILNELYKKYQSPRSNVVMYENESIRICKKIKNGKSGIVFSRGETFKNDPGEWEWLVNLHQNEKKELLINEIGLTVTARIVDYSVFTEKKECRSCIFVTIKEDDVIIIRNRRKGDKIRLDFGSRKIKDLLIEKKLDNSDKNCVPLIVINGFIAAFLPGFMFDVHNRVSEDFKVNQESKKILAIEKKL